MNELTPCSDKSKRSSLFYFLVCFAIASIFILQNHTNGFNTEHHGFTSSRGALMSKGLIVDNHFVMLFNKQLLKDGTVNYHPYNRFPIFPFLLTGAVMQIFEPDLSMQIYIARQVMNVFIVAALLLSIFMIKKLITDQYLSLSVSLFAFSSYYLLYYNDMIFNDTPALFGFVLALFLVVKCHEDTFRKPLLFLFPILSISTGWQPYAVFMTWFVVDAFDQIRQKRRWSDIITIFRRPAFIVLSIAIIYGILILGIELLLEWNLRGGSFWKLPSIDSMFGRMGVTTHGFEWDIFVLKQIYRITNMLIPFSGILTGHLKLTEKLGYGWTPFILGLSFCLISVVFFLLAIVRFKKRIKFYLFYIFILSGFFWSLPMRHFTAYHDYQAPFYIGLSLMFFVVLSLYVKPAFVKTVAVCSCLLFVISVYQMNKVKSIDSQRLNAITEDFEKIYAKLPKNSKVFVDSKGRYKDSLGMDVGRNELSAELGIGGQSIDFFLVGHYRVFPEDAEYIISKNPNYNREKLTDNPIVNLFKNTKQ